MLNKITQEMQSNFLALAKTLKGWDSNLRLKSYIDEMMGFPDLYSIDHQVLEYCDELIHGTVEDVENLRLNINTNLPVAERSTDRK